MKELVKHLFKLLLKIKVINYVIKATRENAFASGKALLILYHTFLEISWLWFRRKELLHQVFLTGISSFFVVSIVAAFSGMIISLQTGLALKDFGQQDLIGQVIIVTLTREFSPFMTTLILAASVGSAMSAELGTMTVSEEIDALEVMSIDPIRYLILPRIIGFSITVPILSAYASVVGTLGGGLISKTQLGVDFSIYFNSINEVLRSAPGLKDIWVGLFKALVFGFVVSTIASYQGLNARGGAIGVGIAVRKSVVQSFLFVLIIGFYITSFFYS